MNTEVSDSKVHITMIYFYLQFLKSTKGAQAHMPLTIHRLLCGLACRGK